MPSTILTEQQQEALGLLGELSVAHRFYLAGGTGLAIQLEHRESLDLYLFTSEGFDSNALRSEIRGAAVLQETRGTLTILLKKVQVSFFEFRYPLLRPLLPFNGVSLAHVDDIAAMKVSAIAGRSSRRDFVDLYCIAQQRRPLVECLRLFQDKFGEPSVDRYHLLRSLVYFDDAEREEMPRMLRPLRWGEVREFFRREVKALSGR